MVSGGGQEHWIDFHVRAMGSKVKTAAAADGIGIALADGSTSFPLTIIYIRQ